MDYNKDRKKVEEAVKQVKRDFAKKYGQIQKSELSAEEKQEQINELYANTKSTIEILWNTNSLEQLSSEEMEELGIHDESQDVKVDTNVVDALVSIFAQRVKVPSDNGVSILDRITLEDGQQLKDIDTSAFEAELRSYFTEHYYDLLSDGYNNFVSNITQVKGDMHENNGELTEIAIKHGIDPMKFHCFGYQLTVQDGLVVEEDKNLSRTNVFYASPEAINTRIDDIYSDMLYSEQSGDNYSTNKGRELKNKYITYAEQNGIEVQNKDALEEIPVDMAKVQGIASYINRVLNKEGKISGDMTQSFAAEIAKNYSKIMQLDYYGFSDLEAVKNLTNGEYITGLHLKIEEDAIVNTEDLRPGIAYATPEYARDEYRITMGEIRGLANTDAFLGNYFDVIKANRKKDELKRYIAENGIEGIDTSIPEAEVDHERTAMIADAILEQYGEDYEDKEGMRARILAKVEARYPELITERQVVSLKELIGDELVELGRHYSLDNLYVQENFVFVGDAMGGRGTVVYATPEDILDKVEVLNDRIATRDIAFDDEDKKKLLEDYAKEHNLGIEIPSVQSARERREAERNMFSNSPIFSRFERDMLPDDPTARPKIELNDTGIDMMVKMAEGLPGAIVGMKAIMEADENGLMLLLGLDDMNIRGSQIWQAYKYLYNEDGKAFVEGIKNRSQEIVDFVNENLASVGGEKAVTGGASFDRNKKPNKYRFTEEEVEELKANKEARIERQNEELKERLAKRTGKKKSVGQKHREAREAKKKAYREALLAKGKRSIAELDEELTELQEKEQDAKALCEEYEAQLPNKPDQEEL
ncbi:MAG: hypothetical protein HFJ24_04730 [Clostridia bacterium]|nr:hypothetical protein [Clostridia bacterium]MCI9275279.1 hypothetical protein [Clostridia bacterium]